MLYWGGAAPPNLAHRYMRLIVATLAPALGWLLAGPPPVSVVADDGFRGRAPLSGLAETGVRCTAGLRPAPVSQSEFQLNKNKQILGRGNF